MSDAPDACRHLEATAMGARGGYVPPHARARRATKTSASASASASGVGGARALDGLEKEMVAAAKKCKKRGVDVAEGFAAYERALEGLRALVRAEGVDGARVALSEGLLEYAGEVVRRARLERLGETSREDERRALERASALAKEALEMFERVEGEPVVRSNGMATALSQAAEYGAHGDDARGKATVLRRAVEAYDAAATTIEGSGNVGEGLLPALWNCADARLKAAEAAAELDDVGAAATLYDEAFNLYERACGYCDASQGDDLGSFLYDWGCSLTSYAQFLLQTNERTAAATAAERAVEKLRNAARFSTGAVEPLNALGDVYQTQAEIALREDETDAEHHAETALRRAREDAYETALRADAADLDATVGVGETMMSYAAILRRRGDAESARAAYADAWRAYERALSLDDALHPAACEERFAIVYNAACAANRTGDVIRARELIHGLLLCGFTSRDVVDADDDLREDASFVSVDA